MIGETDERAFRLRHFGKGPPIERTRKFKVPFLGIIGSQDGPAVAYDMMKASVVRTGAGRNSDIHCIQGRLPSAGLI